MDGPSKIIPVIDLFAGPGGLSEGFSRYSDFKGSDMTFNVKLSIEKDPVARKTLRLRSFVRQFPEGRLPDAYYDYIRCTDMEERRKLLPELEKLPEWRAAEHEAWLAELGEVDFEVLHQRIQGALGQARNWVLLGGPPCQVYSNVGRARRLGHGRALRDIKDDSERKEKYRKKHKEFFGDIRHHLYREYLKIVAIHQPAVFVMENVAGILSARLPSKNVDDGSSRGKLVFDRILQDMKNPWAALEEEGVDGSWWRYGSQPSHSYKIHSFANPPRPLTNDYTNSDYLIECEKFGIPQARHRVILLGVREDINLVPRTLENRAKPVSVKSVIGSLPSLRSGRSHGVDSPSAWLNAIGKTTSDAVLDTVDDSRIRNRMRDIRNRKNTNLTRGELFIEGDWEPTEVDLTLARWISDPDLGGVCQHETRTHMDPDFARYLFAAVYGETRGTSPKFSRFPTCLLPNHSNVFKTDRNGRRQLRGDFNDRFRVQVSGEPARTVVSHIAKDGHYFIHYDPEQCRSLTVREAARIQTFPDNYFFEGNRTQQYQQVGNAVPPFLALKLAEVVAELLQQLTAGSAEQNNLQQAVSAPAG